MQRKLPRLLLLLLAAAAPASSPVLGPLRIIGGGSTGGCIAGAVRLPAQGAGFQTIHLGRSSFWGAPQTIAGVETLGTEAHAAGFGDLYVEDISTREVVRCRAVMSPIRSASTSISVSTPALSRRLRCKPERRSNSRAWSAPTCAASIRHIGRPVS